MVTATLRPALHVACLALAVSGAAAQEAPDADLRAASLGHVNDARAEARLSELERGPILEQAAQGHAEDMLARDFYAHVSPEGEGPRNRFLAAGGGEWELVAENIARCSGCAELDEARIEGFHEGWMNSPEHRANILRGGLSRYGFGAAAGDGVIYAVQMFAGPGEARGGDSAAISADEVTGIAVATLNEARQAEGIPAVAAHEDLVQAARRLVPEEISGFGLGDIGALGDALPGSGTGWSRLNAVAGACGGCGGTLTAGDVRSFVSGWLDGARRQDLLGPGLRAAGMTLRTDGQGRKIALLLLGAAR